MEFLSTETLELLQTTAQEAQSITTEVKEFPNNPEKRMLIRSSGEMEVIDVPFVAPPRKHKVETLKSFAEAFNRWGKTSTDDGSVETISLPNIWLDMPNLRLTFFTDEPIRRSSVTLNLRLSPQFRTMQMFGGAQHLEQKALVRLLRHDLADCVSSDVLPAFRSVDFQKITNARAAIEHSKQSLDSDVTAQVLGEKKPESFQVNFPLFATKELEDATSRVRVTIDIDCDNRKFVLQALPGHLDMAMEDARAAVLTRLETELTEFNLEDATILAGSPE